MRAGFTGGVLIDYPNSAKAKKFFLGKIWKYYFAGFPSRIQNIQSNPCPSAVVVRHYSFTQVSSFS